MPEEQAFSVLVKIMFNYGHREMFKPGFELLHCMLFQLDKLIEVRKCLQSNQCHSLYMHSEMVGGRIIVCFLR